MRNSIRHASLWLAAMLAIALFVALSSLAHAEPSKLDAALATLRAVGDKGEGLGPAQDAWKVVAAAGPDDLVQVLRGMKGAGPIAENYFRAAIDAIAERAAQEKQPLPIPRLTGLALDRTQSPRARRLAYELAAAVDAKVPDQLMPRFLDDPSLELRRDAVARLIEAAGKADGEKGTAVYEQALGHARDLRQFKACVAALEKTGQKIDIPARLGFLTAWKLIGPFDNAGRKGFAAVYPPETKIDYAASHDGKAGPVKWVDHTTSDPYGVVDLNVAIAKQKGVAAYAAAEFEAPAARKVELRIGSENANKVWLNGKLLSAHEVYHTGMEIDQYIAPAELVAGRNVILVKVCQDEMEESWTEAWKFQLRVTDELGGPAK